VVGAAGGLGGFVPPLVMGSLYGHLTSYALGLIALGVVALLAVALAAESARRTPQSLPQTETVGASRKRG
jgi:NNP family nitrate/nitrite transporter-like MFS transporter